MARGPAQRSQHHAGPHAKLRGERGAVWQRRGRPQALPEPGHQQVLPAAGSGGQQRVLRGFEPSTCSCGWPSAADGINRARPCCESNTDWGHKPYANVAGARLQRAVVPWERVHQGQRYRRAAGAAVCSRGSGYAPGATPPFRGAGRTHTKRPLRVNAEVKPCTPVKTDTRVRSSLSIVCMHPSPPHSPLHTCRPRCLPAGLAASLPTEWGHSGQGGITSAGAHCIKTSVRTSQHPMLYLYVVVLNKEEPGEMGQQRDSSIQRCRCALHRYCCACMRSSHSCLSISISVLQSARQLSISISVLQSARQLSIRPGFLTAARCLFALPSVLVLRAT